MASYNSQYYDSWAGGYDSAPTQSSFAYDYNHDHSLFNYDPSPTPSPYYYADYVSNFVQHTPALSQSVVSYSTTEFNEPEFEEYDPTPYGGGYDIVSTYGKPLPPSDQTCYRRDGVKTKESPPKQEIKVPAPAPATEPQPKQPQVNSVHETPTIADKISGLEEAEADQGRNEMGYYYPFAWDTYDTQSGYGSGSGSGSGNDGFVSCSCCCHGEGGGGESQQPNWSANYIFGCSRYPYGQGREFGGNYPNPIFGYERHYQQQSLQGELQYQDPQFLNVETNFLYNNSSYYQ